jgi:hypothetical protein
MGDGVKTKKKKKKKGKKKSRNSKYFLRQNLALGEREVCWVIGEKKKKNY